MAHQAVSNNPLKAKFADGLEHFGTIALDVLDVLNTAFGVTQDFTQRCLALG